MNISIKIYKELTSKYSIYCASIAIPTNYAVTMVTLLNLVTPTNFTDCTSKFSNNLVIAPHIYIYIYIYRMSTLLMIMSRALACIRHMSMVSMERERL